tara:strand:- start:431 stop:2161 length:1731 start_codon:yes stop_codon:yes gene_type:complete
MDAQLQGSNPKLQTVKYVNILPEGKQGKYKQNERVDFMPDPSTVPYFDGKQSYLNIRVRNTSTFVAGNSANAISATVGTPLCFPAHIGANAMINRCLIRAKDNSQVIEDLEAYNMFNGIKNAYTHDQDIFKTLGRISGVAGRTCQPMNQTVDNIAINYFLPNGSMGTTGATANAIIGGNKPIDASFCVPVESGLFSAFGGQHHVIPNLDVPIHQQLFLEKANIALQALCSKFFKLTTVEGVAVSEVVARSPFAAHDADLISGKTQLAIKPAQCNTTLTPDGVAYTPQMCAFRVGMPVVVGPDTRIITKVEINGGTGSNQVVLTVDGGFTSATLGDVSFTMAPVVRSYEIDKIELKCLLTIPDAPTMKMIRSQMTKGISFTSIQLYKQSSPASLLNAVLDVPEALTRAGSLLAVPVQQGTLESLDIQNSYMYCRPDAALQLPTGLATGNTNQTTYQWQVGGLLLPNLAVETNSATNANSDNAIFFNQQVMALRHCLKVQSLADSPKARKAQDIDLDLPFFYPLSLAPQGESFNIIDSAPQLRISNSNSTDTTAKLYHIFVVHTRVLKSSNMGATISF